MSEKNIQINGLNINYKEIGDGNITIIFLHGWGINSDKYINLINIFANKNPNLKIIIPDLPGFGKSDEPNTNWNLNDYVEFVDEFIKNTTRKKGFELIKNILRKVSIKNNKYNLISNERIVEKEELILIGHSFGGRIAIKYAVKYPEKIEKIILTGAAGIKHSLTVKQKIIFILTKLSKIIFYLPIIKKLKKYAEKLLYKIVKEKDYYKANSRMKKIMKNVLAEDLTPILEKIKSPTLLLWGEVDNSTPLSDGKLMNKKIKKSELIIIKNANHSLPYQKPEEFIENIINFIKKTEN